MGYPTRPPEYSDGLPADEKKELEEQRDDIVKVVELLLEKWCIPRPNIIISVTGGAGKFDATNIQQRRFKRGIIRAAEKTGFSNLHVPITSSNHVSHGTPLALALALALTLNLKLD